MSHENKIAKDNIENVMALTSTQEGMLFHYISEPNSTKYHEQLSLSVSGQINVQILEEAFNFVIETNEMLRTVFRWKNIDKPVQIVLKNHKVSIVQHDFSKESNGEEKLKDIKSEDMSRTIDITSETLRIYLCKMDEEQYEIIISNHHILYDGWSNGIILKELLNAYYRLCEGKEPEKIHKNKFMEFVKFNKSQDKISQKQFWENYLSDLEENSNLFKISAEKEDLKSFTYALSQETTEKVKKYSKENRISVAAILYFTWGILLQYLTNSKDVVFGTTVSGRNARIKGIDDIVGLFINTIPFRVSFNSDDRVDHLIRRIDDSLKERQEFENTPLVDIKEYSNFRNNASLFDTLVVVENYPLDYKINNNKALRINKYSMVENTNYNITLGIMTFNNMELHFSYNNSVLSEELIFKFGGYFKQVLEVITNDCGKRIREIEILTQEERSVLLNDFNNTYSEYSREKTIQELFEDKVEKTPNSTALIFGENKLTYKELNEKANALARNLRNMGVASGSIVAIMAEKSFEMMIGLMAVLKAGGAYLPIDPKYPDNRVQYILEDSKAKLLLSQKHILDKLCFNVEILDLNDDKLYEQNESNLEHINKAEDLAYIIYTSGTTGNPKGTAIEHRSVINTLTYLEKNYPVSISDVYLFKTNYTFDVSVTEIFGWFMGSGALAIVNNEESRNITAIIDAIKKYRVTHINFVPSMLNMFVEAYDVVSKTESLKYVFAAGEELKPNLVKKFYEKFDGIKLENLYGPTEATIYATGYSVGKNYTGEVIPIGKPVDNLKTYIVDKDYRLMPVGAAGELCLSGEGLARGYINKPELTAEKFVDNPFIKGERMYRTGDLARWLPDGNIEFLGRIDHQVKIRGFRIELGEIENNILTYSGIKEVVVVDREDESGVRYLCAYMEAEREILVGEIRQHLLKKLPEYMIPTYFIQLDKMPLNSNGKIDRKALPKPQGYFDIGTEYEAPRNELEEKLCKVWEEVLGAEKIGINDNFFELGGHSLKATVLVSRMHKLYDVEIPLKVIFSFPTIKGISEYIKSAEKNVHVSIEKVEEKEYYETSSAQKRMYMLQKFDINSTVYNMSSVMEVDGQLDLQKIKYAIEALMLRHDSLRTSFETIDGEIVQKINEATDFQIQLEEVSDETEADKIIKCFVRPFDLARAPLFRVGLVKLNSDKHILMFDMHHIISDGISSEILVSEFAKLYEGKELVDLKLQYKDYSHWQNCLLKSEEMKKQEEYWVNKFSGEVPVLNLPIDYQRPLIKSFEGDVINFSLSEELTRELHKLSKDSGSTLYMVLLSALTILLSRYSGQQDIVVGSPVAGRAHTDLEGIIGMFVNTLAMRNEPEGEKTYEQFLKEVKENALKAYENQNYQFEELVEKLNIPRDMSRNPLFDVMLVVQNMEGHDLNLQNSVFKLYMNTNKTSKFDLTLTALEADRKIVLSLEYCTELFKRETIERMAEHFTNILNSIIENKTEKLKNIKLLGEAEEHKLLHEFNDTYAEYPREKTIQEVFEEQVEKTPDNTAAVFGNEKLTYRELNEEANCLARTLREKGVGRDSIVGLMVERSLEMIIGIIGILKAGGAYLPIDQDYPKDRIEYMLHDSKTKLLLTKQNLLGHISFEGEVLDLSDDLIYAKDCSNLHRINASRNLAYIIYTSGSTGRPKGVMVEHRSLLNYITYSKKRYIPSNDFSVPLFTSLSFDLTVTSIYVPLLSGGKINVYQNTDNLSFTDILKDKLDIMKLTPAHLNLINSLEENNINISRLVVGGEELSSKLAAEVYSNTCGKTEIINEYGPTEATVGCIVYSYREEDKALRSVPIGTPINNTRIHIVDKTLSLVPIGVVGELCISGECLARGYLNNPGMTAEKFIDNPFVNGEKMYRTGDLARWLPDGNIEFLGRIDHQVKIRGFRVELNEIESNILTYRGIRDAIVIDREDEKGSRYLCAYITSDKDIVVKDIRQHLSKKLPDYMLPSYFVRLDKLPLTQNGKVDRKALPLPEGNMNLGNNYEKPRNELEEKLCLLWQEVLGVEKVGINDNFFEIGGHSLKATVLAARIHKELDIELSIKDIFSRPTIKEISEFIQSKEKNIYYSMEKAPEREYYEASSAQKRMYILQQFNLKSTGYNMPQMLLVEGSLDTVRLEKTFNKLIDRHEALRTSFQTIEGEIVQIIADEAKLEVEAIELDEQLKEDFISKVGLIPDRQNKDIYKLFNRFIRPFDLSKAPLLRVGLVKLAEDKNILLLDMHHIISDGVSMSILISEFTKLYDGQSLESLRVQYKDYSYWHNNMLESDEIKSQREYWINRFNDELPILSLPYDYSRPAIQSLEGNIIDFELDRETTKKLRNIAAETNSTMFMVLMASFNILLSKYSSQEDIIVGIPTAGRKHADLESVIGMFVNTLAMRNFPKSNMTFEEFLNEVRENALKAYENQDYQFEELVSQLNIPRDISRNPIFDVMFSMNNMEFDQITTNELKMKLFDNEGTISKFDLILFAEEIGEKIALRISYSTKLFKFETIKRMTAHMHNVLKAIAENKNIELSEIDILSEEEKKKLLCDFNNTCAEYSRENTIHELFEAQVIRTPQNLAAIFEGKSLTYTELNEKANSLARMLRNHGVRKDSIVGIMTERSLEMIVGIMAILKAGGAYMPISPDYPEERVLYMLKDSEADILLTQDGITGLEEFSGQILSLREDYLYREDSSNLERINGSRDLAYVIYTSGSTGKPKGVMIEHHSLINRLNWMQKAYPINEEDVILQKTPFTFDVSVWEMFWWGLLGAKVVFLVPGGEKEPKAIVEAIKREQVTVMHFVPSMLNVFLEYLKEYPNLVHSVSSLRQVFASGEALTLRQVEQFNKILCEGIGAKLTNLYGPTEATVDVSYFDCSTGEAFEVIPIGKPIDNIKLFVVDKNLKLQPVGVSGELCISGVGLARGYLNKPQLTAEKFVDNPFEAGEKMYRTGDLVRMLQDGNVEFLGRIDNQVKIRGHRIELGEIENCLRKHPYIKDAVVLAKEDEQGEKYLSAYIETDKIHLEAVENKPRYTLPNNMAIVQLNKNETDFMYNEIFIEQNYIKQGITINEGDCILDIGANIGMFSLFVNQLEKDIQIYSFEPIPELYELLRINTGLYNENTKVFNCGISNENTETTFTFYPKASIMSGKYGDLDKEKDTFEKTLKSQLEPAEQGEDFEKLYNELIQERFEAKQVVCQLKTLSDIIEENNIEKIDLLKIDVEKSEMDVLQGIKSEHFKIIKQIVLEVHDIDGQLNKVLYLLRNNGFSVFTGRDNELESTDMYNVYAIAEWCSIKEIEDTEAVIIQPMENHLLTKGKLIDYLKGSLPEYMIPLHIVQLEKMPLNPNGKIDRKQLSKLTAAMVMEKEYAAPRNSVEERLCEIWAGILGVKNIGINDSFLDLGGHSLKATVLASKIYKEFDVEIRLKDIFNGPTIKEISEYIQKAEKNDFVSIEKIPEREYYETSSAQKRMYILQQFDRNSTVYNMPWLMEVEGKLDIKRIEQAIRTMMRRHEILRTYFENINGEIIQKISKEIYFKVEYADEIELAQAEAAAAAHLEAYKENKANEVIKKFVRSFDLGTAPLFRVGLVRVQKEKYLLMFDMHHIISDGVSMGILINEFTQLYEGKELKELKLQYKDYSHWQNNLLNTQKMKKQERYWVDRFSDEIPVLNMPTDYPRALTRSFEGDCINLVLNKELGRKLNKLGKETGSTLYMILLSAVNILLSKYSGQEDIVVGSPVAGRTHTDLEGIIGMFVNTLPMRNEPKGVKTFEEFLEEVKENALKAYENQDYQFEELVDKLNLASDMSRNPVFDIMFALQNMENQEIHLKEAVFRQYNNENKISKFDFTISAVEKFEEIELSFEYNTKLFKKETIGRMANHFKNILESITENKEICLKDIEILEEDEKYRLIHEFNDTYTEYPREKTIHELFEEQAEKIPNHTAVIFGDSLITYGELNEKANRLARTLKNKGVGPNSIVPIMAERSLEMVVGIIAILKAEGAYLPIDPDYPEERIMYMLQDSRAALLLTQTALLHRVSYSGEVIDLLEETNYSYNGSNLGLDSSSKDLAYVIYTSGSTGKPKGVMIEHESLHNFLLSFNNKYINKFSSSDRCLSITNISFDVSVCEIFISLTSGASLVISQKYNNYDAREISRLIIGKEITFAYIPPSLLKDVFHELTRSNKNIFLNKLLVGVEPIEYKLFHQYADLLSNIEIVNGYGPTEGTICSTMYNVDKNNNSQKFISIGSPLQNTKIYIVDRNLSLVPMGVCGELCISGDGLARGYLNNSKLNAEKFVDNPFVKGDRMYRTGDLAKWLSDGNIEFLGRIDHQVKIRGYRIELGEIESNILTFKGISKAVVVDRKDESGNKYLCAYFVGEKEIAARDLRQHILSTLPDYMIPSYFIQLDRIPINSSGKIDRKSLPKPEVNIKVNNKHEAPRNEIEQKLERIWEEVLGIEQVGLNDNFFELGGHSLKAIQVINLIEKRMNIKVELSDLFNKATIASLAEIIAEAVISKEDIIEKLPKQDYYDLSYSQKRLWIINELNPDSIAYNMPVQITLREKVDADIVRLVFEQLIIRHEALRTKFAVVDGKPVQVIEEFTDVPLKFLDISEMDDIDKSALREEIFKELAVRKFNLQNSPLIYITLVKVDDEQYDLDISMHHIISDGWSMEVLRTEFYTLYNSYKRGKAESLKPLTIQYKDFASWQNKLLKDENRVKEAKDFWIKQLSGQLPVMELPVTYSYSNLKSRNSAGYKIRLSEDIKAKLKYLAAKHNTSIFMVILSIVNFFLSNLTKQKDVLISTAGLGRNHADLNNVIGYFINTTILRSKINMEENFEQLLERVNGNTLKALEYQYYPLELILDELKIKYPTINVFINMLNMGQSDKMYIEDFKACHIEKVQDVKFDLVWYITEYANGVEINCNYLSDLFDPMTIEFIMNKFIKLLENTINNTQKPLKELTGRSKRKI